MCWQWNITGSATPPWVARHSRMHFLWITTLQLGCRALWVFWGSFIGARPCTANHSLHTRKFLNWVPMTQMPIWASVLRIGKWMKNYWPVHPGRKVLRSNRIIMNHAVGSSYLPKAHRSFPLHLPFFFLTQKRRVAKIWLDTKNVMVRKIEFKRFTFFNSQPTLSIGLLSMSLPNR